MTVAARLYRGHGECESQISEERGHRVILFLTTVVDEQMSARLRSSRGERRRKQVSSRSLDVSAASQLCEQSASDRQSSLHQEKEYVSMDVYQFISFNIDGYKPSE